MRNVYSRNNRERRRAAQLVLRRRLVLGRCEVALRVFNLVDALQRLMLHVVPLLHAVAIRSRVVTRLTRAVRVSDGLGRVLLGDSVPLVVILDDELFAGVLSIAVLLPAHYFVHSRRRVGRKRRTDHAASCSHRQHPPPFQAPPSVAVSHDLFSILSCRACGSSALSLSPPSNLEQARTPHTRKMAKTQDIHLHRRIRTNMMKGSNGYPSLWVIEARRVFAYRENRMQRPAVRRDFEYLFATAPGREPGGSIMEHPPAHTSTATQFLPP